jgi:hypothetical protein
MAEAGSRHLSVALLIAFLILNKSRVAPIG